MRNANRLFVDRGETAFDEDIELGPLEVDSIDSSFDLSILEGGPEFFSSLGCLMNCFEGFGDALKVRLK